MEFNNVTAQAKANIYFDGKVVSHKITDTAGDTKTMGVIFAGEYHFATEAAERMDITDGACLVKLDGSEESQACRAGEYFEVAANAGFTITVQEGTCQYVCSYLA